MLRTLQINDATKQPAETDTQLFELLFNTILSVDYFIEHTDLSHQKPMRRLTQRQSHLNLTCMFNLSVLSRFSVCNFTLEASYSTTAAVFIPAQHQTADRCS